MAVMSVRPARASDADVLTPLLFQSGERLLTDIFGNGDADLSRDFLRHAWSLGSGQYGFGNHWAVCEGNQAIGVFCCWHDQLPENFDTTTLTSIRDFYSLADAISIIERSKHWAQYLPAPRTEDIAVGHLGVVATHRRRGAASVLMQQASYLAKRYHKQFVVLDVETTNQTAYAFYQAKGFSVHSENPYFKHMQLAV